VRFVLIETWQAALRLPPPDVPSFWIVEWVWFRDGLVELKSSQCFSVKSRNVMFCVFSDESL